jgi:hypothetical protein
MDDRRTYEIRMRTSRRIGRDCSGICDMSKIEYKWPDLLLRLVGQLVWRSICRLLRQLGLRMTNSGVRWVAKITADSAADIDALLGLSLGLDVWERHGDSLVVAASESRLLELERRRLVRVDRLTTQAEFEARARGGPHSAGEGGPA